MLVFSLLVKLYLLIVIVHFVSYIPRRPSFSEHLILYICYIVKGGCPLEDASHSFLFLNLKAWSYFSFLFLCYLGVLVHKKNPPLSVKIYERKEIKMKFQWIFRFIINHFKTLLYIFKNSRNNQVIFNLIGWSKYVLIIFSWIKHYKNESQNLVLNIYVKLKMYLKLLKLVIITMS